MCFNKSCILQPEVTSPEPPSLLRTKLNTAIVAEQLSQQKQHAEVGRKTKKPVVLLGRPRFASSPPPLPLHFHSIRLELLLS